MLTFLLAMCLLAHSNKCEAQEITAEDVRRAISNGVRSLKERQAAGGNWDEPANFDRGVTPLVGLSLLNAGVSPDDPTIQKAIEYIKDIPYQRLATYSVSLRLMMLAAADPSGKKYRSRIEDDVEFLLKMQTEGGGWGYGRNGVRRSASVNASTSQFALLALHEASLLGVKIPQKNWLRAKDYWERSFVRNNGGFGYRPGDGNVRGSMVCAGISSVLIIDDNLAENKDLIVNGKVNCCGDNRESMMIEAAINWLARSFRVNGNPESRRRADMRTKFYYLYALERAGRLSGRRFIGAHDWYREGAEHLLATQQMGGGWRGRPPLGESNVDVTTALALLFLSKGKRPIVIGKYSHGIAADWDRHPKGVHLLSRQLESDWNKKLNWQTVNGKEATVDDLLESPVLFISGRDRLNLNAKQKTNLKKYIETGGFIFAEACQGDGCGKNAEFHKKFVALMEELFPDSKLEPLPRDHAIWNAHYRLTKVSTRPLLGLQACCRTSVVYCPANLSCFWQVNRPQLLEQLNADQREIAIYCTQLGVNVVSYATGRELRDKLDMPRITEATENALLGDRNLVLPKLEHSGGSDEAPNAWRRVLTESSRLGLRIKLEKKMISATEEQLADHPFVFMHGRDFFSFSKEERQALRDHLNNKGMLFVDSICSSRAFSDAFRAEMGKIFPERPLERISSTHELWNDERFGGKLKKVTLQIRDAAAVGGFRKQPTEPLLEGIEIDGQLAVIFSPHDLSCALENAIVSQCEGYTHDDSIEIARRVLLYYLQTD